MWWVIIDIDNPTKEVLDLSALRDGIDFELVRDICMMWTNWKAETTKEYINFLKSLPRWKVLGQVARMQAKRGEFTPWEISVFEERSGHYKVIMSLSLMQEWRGMITPIEYRILKDLTHHHGAFQYRIFAMLWYLRAGQGMPVREELEKLLDCCRVGNNLNTLLLKPISIQYRGLWLPQGQEYERLLETCIYRQKKYYDSSLLSGGTGYKRPDFEWIEQNDENPVWEIVDEVDGFLQEQSSLWWGFKQIFSKKI